MDEENKTTGGDVQDTKGLQDEGVDIIGGTGNNESDYSNTEDSTPELSPVFPEDESFTNNSIKDIDEEISEPAKPVEAIKTPTPKVEPPQATADVPLAPIKPISVSMPKPIVVEDIYSGIPTQTNTHNDPSIKSIRTYRSDAAEAIQGQHFSVASIAVAASKKRESNQVEYSNEGKGWSWLAILFSIILIISSVGGLYYVYKLKSSVKAPTIAKSAVVSLLKSEKQIELSLGTSENLLESFSNLVDTTDSTVDSVVYVYPTTVSSGAKALVTAQQFFAKTTPNMPSRLLRSLGNEFMLGSYVFDGKIPFIILKNTFYQNAYSGMLEWEKNMNDDLSAMVQKRLQQEATQPNFEDSVIRNKDVRTLKTIAGDIVLAYVFIDQSTILITTNTKALENLIDKITATRVVQ